MPLETVHFEDFELDRSTYELRRGGSIIHLERIPFDLLNLLVERHGQMVTRQEILERIWGKDVHVDADNSAAPLCSEGIFCGGVLRAGRQA